MTSVTIGLDVSDRYSRMCVLDSKGRVMEEGRVRTSPEGLARRFGCEEPARVVLEVGTHSPWMSEQLKQLGHEVLVANPRRLKLIYGEHGPTGWMPSTWHEWAEWTQSCLRRCSIEADKRERI